MNNFLTITSRDMVLAAIRLPEAILDCVLISSGALMGAGSGLLDNVLGKIGRAVVKFAPGFLRVLWYFSRSATQILQMYSVCSLV